MNLFFFSSPPTFYRLAGTMAPWFFALAAVFAAAGLYIGFRVAPVDAVQGEVYRIIFLHVPAAWMSMFLYFVMACYCGLTLVFNTRLSAMMARAIAPTGALFTFLALWTGSFWGKPTWGTYWVWDARLTSELVLLFLYLLGSLANRTWDHVNLVWPWALVCIPLAFMMARPLNLLQLGDDVAEGLGLRVVRSSPSLA